MATPSGKILTPDLSSTNHIQSNQIGIASDTSNTTINPNPIALANLGDGIQLEGISSMTIGGEDPTSNFGTTNIISGNGSAGIHILGFNPTGPDGIPGSGPTIIPMNNAIQGNIIGTAVMMISPPGSGSLGLPFVTVPTASNSGDGILLEGASQTTIGGANPIDLNLISGNGGAGIHIIGISPPFQKNENNITATGNTIQNNFSSRSPV